MPTRLKEVFRTRRLMAKCCDRIEELHTRIGIVASGDGGGQVGLAQVQAALTLAKSLIAEGMPYCQCRCQRQGNPPGEECDLCHGKGWINGAEYLPASHRTQL